MSLYILLIIMAFAGICGGCINYFLSLRITSENNNYSFISCICVGIGATILIPLFLEIAQSKLLDNIRTDWAITVEFKQNALEIPEDGLGAEKDSLNTINHTSKISSLEKQNNVGVHNEQNPPIKTYLLFAAYCFLAAAAGPRFINSLIDGVLKDKEIQKLTKEKGVITKEKNIAEEKVEKRNVIDSLLASAEEDVAIQSTANPKTMENLIKPRIGPKTVKNDPQKGRFGGARERNGRKLCAKVSKSLIPEFYKVNIWVESTDPNKPLNSDVVFYLHDTFRPSVLTVKPGEFDNGKAKVDSKNAWGAFTVGAVADDGITLLEYDLSEDPAFPLDFRSK
jgi:hypothetical protein